MTHLEQTFDRSVPPEGLIRPLQALWWLRKGGFQLGPEWEAAHNICQEREGDPDYDIVHALAHWIEGDRANSEYWYRRAGSSRARDFETEWRRISGLLCRPAQES